MADNIGEVLEVLGVEVTRESEEELYARCPGHRRRVGKADRRPSWSINRRTGVHHCFSCGYGGDLVSLVSDVLDTGVWGARQFLRDRRITDFFDRRERLRVDEVGPAPEVATLPEAALASFDGVVPAEVLYDRGIDRASCALYDVRWDTRRRGWVFPLRLPTGELIGYQLKTETGTLNLPRGVQKSVTLFGLDVLHELPPVVVESPMDVLYLHTVLNQKRGLATFGSVMSHRQVQCLQDVTDDVIIAMDNDDAGRRSARTFRTNYSRVFNTWFFRYPDGKAKDPGELAPDEVRQGIEEAVHSVRVRLES